MTSLHSTFLANLSNGSAGWSHNAIKARPQTVAQHEVMANRHYSSDVVTISPEGEAAYLKLLRRSSLFSNPLLAASANISRNLFGVGLDEGKYFIDSELNTESKDQLQTDSFADTEIEPETETMTIDINDPNAPRIIGKVDRSLYPFGLTEDQWKQEQEDQNQLLLHIRESFEANKQIDHSQREIAIHFNPLDLDDLNEANVTTGIMASDMSEGSFPLVNELNVSENKVTEGKAAKNESVEEEEIDDWEPLDIVEFRREIYKQVVDLYAEVILQMMATLKGKILPDKQVVDQDLQPEAIDETWNVAELLDTAAEEVEASIETFPGVSDKPFTFTIYAEQTGLTIKGNYIRGMTVATLTGTNAYDEEQGCWVYTIEASAGWNKAHVTTDFLKHVYRGTATVDGKTIEYGVDSKIVEGSENGDILLGWDHQNEDWIVLSRSISENAEGLDDVPIPGEFPELTDEDLAEIFKAFDAEVLAFELGTTDSRDEIYNQIIDEFLDAIVQKMFETMETANPSGEPNQ